MHRLAALAHILLLGAACLGARAQEAPTEGRIVGNTYKNDRLGWEMAIPPGWTLIPKAEVDRLEDKGREVIEQSANAKIEPRHSQLLYLQKDRLNRFTSTAQKHDPKQDGPYKDSQEAVFRTLVDAFRSQGIPVEVKRRKESIGGLEFESMHLTFLSRDRTGVVFEQVIYDRLINDRSLMISILFNNESDRRAVYGALKRSRFSAAK